MMLCYVILNYNDYNTTIKCIESIKDYKCINKIIVVDNKSTDDSFEKLKQFATENVDIIRTDRNGGYGYGNNYGIRYANKMYHPEFVVISNPDVYIEENSIIRCADFLEKNTDCAIVSLLMKNMNGANNYRCVWKLPTYFQYLFFSSILGSRINFNYEEKEFEKDFFYCDCVAGSWLMVRTEDFIEIGMYDENVFLYCEEVILGIKAKLNEKRTAILTHNTFTHMHSVSISKTFKKDIDQQKLMWKSRLYVLNNYYNKSFFNKSFSYLFMRYALIERRLINLVRFIKRRKRNE